MSIRTKSLGAVAAVAAFAVTIPMAVHAYAEPTTTTTATTTPTTTAPAQPESTTSTTSSAPNPAPTNAPDPVGSGCDAYKSKNGTGAGSFGTMFTKSATDAIASNPELSTFSGLISGKLNPDVNIVSVIDGGPYVVFAPTNAAFDKLDPATLETLKSDPIKLVPVLFYHLVLGYLSPNDVAGKMPTQDGRSVVVTGKGSDVKVNDNKITCAYPVRGAYIYMIDSVLTPPTPAAEAASATTSGSATTSATTSGSATTSATETTSTSATSTATTSASETSTPPASTSATATASATETPATTTAVKPAA